MSLDFNNQTVWQIGTGDPNRDFSQIFFDFGILVMGAADDLGPYDKLIRPYEGEKWGDASDKIRPIATDMEIGHIVILKNGKNIVGVGKIIGGYTYDAYDDWRERFSEELKNASVSSPKVEISYSKTRLDDVDGWDLRHTRRVEWWSGPKIQCKSLTRQACSRVNSPEVINSAKKFMTQATKANIQKSLPDPAELLTNEDVISNLMDEGLSSERSEELSKRLSTLQRLAKWYYNESGEISEHEIRAYLVWPLLQVLGWSEQCVKFEWKNLDLALLKEPYTKKTKNQVPIIIGETKSLRSGLNNARKQAESYSLKYNVFNILITDGVRYLYKRKINNYDIEYSYMNLLKLRKRHPYYADIFGADKLLELLLKK